MSTDRRKLAKILVPAALVLVICCGGVAWYLANQSPKTYGVPLVVNAEGLDTEKGTKIPLHATGEDARGNHVDEVFYGGTDSSDVTLASGAYTLSIEDSPIAEDGTIYNTEGAFTKADISKDGGADVESEITITPIPAEDVTDEEIEKAYNAAKSSGIEASSRKAGRRKAGRAGEGGPGFRWAFFQQRLLLHRRAGGLEAERMERGADKRIGMAILIRSGKRLWRRGGYRRRERRPLAQKRQHERPRQAGRWPERVCERSRRWIPQVRDFRLEQHVAK